MEKIKKMDSIWEEYNKIELINSSCFTNIYRAKNKKTNEYVAIKEIKKTSQINADDILKSIEIMVKLKSENSVSLIDSIETKECYYLVLELCYISLDDYIKMRKDALSIEEIREVLLELNEYLKEMNNKNIIHKDLKPSNILLSLNKFKINKICFKILYSGLNDTPNTLAPEILKGEDNLISYKSDIWSLGVIIYYMLFKEYPYNGNEYHIIKEIESKKPLKTINNNELDNLIKQMLVENINERITWKEYFQNPFFQIDNSNQSMQISNQFKFPIFNLKCDIHSENLIGYCPTCKCNICLKCCQEHSLKNHQVFLFFEIGFSEDEIKQIDNLTNQIENNLKQFKKMKEEIYKFIHDIKSIKKNGLVYNDDNKNNYKNYSIEYLKIMNDKLLLNEKIDFPVFPKWEYRYNKF